MELWSVNESPGNNWLGEISDCFWPDSTRDTDSTSANLQKFRRHCNKNRLENMLEYRQRTFSMKLITGKLEQTLKKKNIRKLGCKRHETEKIRNEIISVLFFQYCYVWSVTIRNFAQSDNLWSNLCFVWSEQKQTLPNTQIVQAYKTTAVLN